MKQQSIRIYPNVPMDLVLAFTQGKICAHGKMMFSSVDGRALFVTEAAGRQIQAKLNDLRIQVGDRVLITQFTEFGAGGKETTWQVVRASVPCGQQKDGSFIVPSQPGAASPHGAPPPAVAAPPQPQRRISPEELWARFDRLEELIAGLNSRLDRLEQH